MSQQTLIMAVIGIILVIDAALLLYAAIRWFRKREIAFSEPWNLADAWFGVQYTVVMLGVLVGLFAGVMVALNPAIPLSNIESFDFSNVTTTLNLWLPSFILQDAVLFAVPAALIVLKYGYRLRDIGLPPLPSGRDWKLGLSLGVLLLLVTSGIGWGLERLAQAFDHIPMVKQALEYERTNPVNELIQVLPRLGIPGLILAILGVGIGPGFGEEMLFRGFLFNVFRKQWGLWAGILLSALVFTVGHTYALGLLPVFLMGVALAWIYHRTGSLWIPILIHAVNNTASVVIAFFFPETVAGT
ncbi:MAG: hypothetical protein OHK0029_14440 [Armatimonadaceae bacterium]